MGTERALTRATATPPAMPFAALRDDLDRLAAAGRGRSLALPAGRDFSSNDYLGLARSDHLRAAVRRALEDGSAIGSGGSRLLRGHWGEHAELEAAAAAFFGAEAALFFGSGFAANVALFATLPQRGDLILHDALIHASAHDGLRLARATAVACGHNDAGRIEHELRRWRRAGGAGRAWIAVESLYSMDGDLAPLADFAAVAERHDAILLIDEAHATGVFGPDGRGLAAEFQGRENVVTLHTCGKAMGTEGALVCGPAVVRAFLINRARSFIFSTAPSPLIAAATGESLRVLADEPARRATLWANVRRAEALLAPLGVPGTGSQIIPVVIGDDARTMTIAAALRERGLDVRGVRPPTVPPGTARLRVSITGNVGTADIAALAEGLAETLR